VTGSDLRTVRESLGLTQAELASLLFYRSAGVAAISIYRWETTRGASGEVATSGAGVPQWVEFRLRAMARKARVRWPLPGRAPKCECCGR